MKHLLIQGDVLDILPTLGDFPCCFMDPPDAIGLRLNGYEERPRDGYIEWLTQVTEATVLRCGITWVSYNAIWDLAVKHWAHFWLHSHPEFEIRPFVWTYTFGQNRNSDCGPGHRPILRFRRKGAPLYPDQIKVASWRELHGDKRAAKGGRVPLDAWTEFPRVVGNAKERRPYHPTQHPEALVERAIKLSTREGDKVLDLFSGTGTVIRVCRRINRQTTSVELNEFFCRKIAEEHALVRCQIETFARGGWAR
jgi:site-specific DNA-methyltransferase (adenine-specific)